MSIASLQHTLTAIGSNQVSSESLSTPMAKTLDKILNIITMGIYGAYKTSVASEMKNDLLDLGKAIIMWDPASAEIPMQLTLDDRRYEISDLPQGGIRFREYPEGESKEIEGVSLFSLRNMIFSELMNHSDFSEAMVKRVYETATVHVDIIGMQQERANACSEASRNMILAYHGIDYDPATNSRSIFEGNSKQELVAELRRNGLVDLPLLAQGHKAYTCEQIQESLKKGPLLCELENHYLVVHGVNALLGRIDVYCPLLGNRCASLEDLNAHLDWEQEYMQAPLMQFEKIDDSDSSESPGFGRRKDADFSFGIIDRLGVSVLATASAIGNSWLKIPDNLPRVR